MPEPTEPVIVHLRVAGENDRFITYPFQKLALQEVDEFSRMMSHVSEDARTSAEIVIPEERSQPLVDFIGVASE